MRESAKIRQNLEASKEFCKNKKQEKKFKRILKK